MPNEKPATPEVTAQEAVEADVIALIRKHEALEAQGKGRSTEAYALFDKIRETNNTIAIEWTNSPSTYKIDDIIRKHAIKEAPDA